MSTKIEWADMTINPVVGCSKCSPGCDNCYAEKMAWRLSKMPKTAERYAGVVDENGWTGKVNITEQFDFSKLYTASKPKRIFLGSMYHVGKKRAGRLLDGREWNEFPEVAQ